MKERKDMSRKVKTNIIGIGSILLFLIVMGIYAFGEYRQENERNREYHFVLIPKTLDNLNGFWTSLIEGAKLGASEYNINLSVYGTYSEDDIKGQIEKLENAILEEPDGIIIAPTSTEEITPSLKKAKEKGIEIVLVDSTITEDIGVSLVSTDNYKAGVNIGQYAKRLLDEDSQIGMVGHIKGVSTAVEREAGMREGLGEFEEKIREVVFCDSTYEKAYSLTIEMMERYPEIDLIMGLNEYSAVGAARAIRDLGLAGQVNMVGFDSSIEEIQFLEQNIFDAIIIQKPVNMGYLAVEQGIKALQGKNVESYVDSGSVLINRGNMYLDENQRLLYPVSGQE
ncbi:ribose transport system substrate-binding protein [Aequitasia blattaphilus]